MHVKINDFLNIPATDSSFYFVANILFSELLTGKKGAIKLINVLLVFNGQVV